MRTERVRNDEVYATKTSVEGVSQDTISSKTNPQSYLTAGNGSIMNGTTPLDMNSKAIRNVMDPVNAQDATTKKYSDDTFVTKTTALDAIKIPENNMNLNGKRVTSIGDATSLSDAVSLYQLNGVNDSLLPRSGIRAMTGNLDLGSQKLINLAPGTLATDAVNKTQHDLKADQQTTYTKTESNSAFKPIAQIETKIQNSTSNSSVSCTTDNKIDIKVNGANRGYFFQPVGQATTPLGLVSSDKLQLQSELSSISVYGSKTIDPLAINTHGLYVSGTDDPQANVQSVVSINQGPGAQLYLAAGHFNFGAGQQDFCAVTGNKVLSLSGGLRPGQEDKQIIMYANNQSQAMPIQTDGKMGYSTAVAIDQANQFTSKTFVDNSISTSAATKLSLSGGTMTGTLILHADPTSLLQASTKQYVDNKIGLVTTGITQAQADLLYYKNTVTLNNITAPTGALAMNNQKITGIINGVLSTDVMTKGYIDGADTTLQGNIDNGLALKLNSSDAATAYLSKTGTVDQTIASNITVAAGKRILQPFVPLTSSDVTNKLYVDTADALALPKTGGTMSGSIAMGTSKITGLGDPTLSQDASTKNYTDTVAATKLNTTGGSITGALSMSANKITNLGTPTTSTDAATKAYVDSSVGSSATAISTANGYKLQTLSDRVRVQTTAGTSLFDLQTSGSFGLYQQLTGNQTQFSIADNSSITYGWGYNVTGNSARPVFQILDVGTEGTLCHRLYSTSQTDLTKSAYINMKPVANRIELSAPAYQLGVYSAPTEQLQLVTKKYVDDLTAASNIPIKIVNDTIGVRCFNDAVSSANNTVIIENSAGSGDYLTMTTNAIRCDNGSTLSIGRGDTQLQIIDDGTSKYLTTNKAMQYATGLITSIANQDQFLSQRLCDTRYVGKTSNSNIAMNGYRVMGLPSGLIAGSTYDTAPTNMSGDAVSWNQMKQYIDYRLSSDNKTRVFGFTAAIGENPSTIEQWSSDLNIVQAVTYTNINSLCGLYTFTLDSTLLQTTNFRALVGVRSQRAVETSADNDFYPIITSRYTATTFSVYLQEDNATNVTQDIEIYGIIFRYGYA